MTPAILALALLTEQQHKLPAGLLTAVVLAETGCRSVVARGRGAGRRGCDVGIAQIHVPGCRAADVRRVLPVGANLVAAAQVLRWSRSWCARHGGARCAESLWFRYNPGSRTWAPTVRRILRRVRRVFRSRHAEARPTI